MRQNLWSVSSIPNENNRVVFNKDSANIYNSLNSVIGIVIKKDNLFKMHEVNNKEAKLFTTTKEMTNKL